MKKKEVWLGMPFVEYDNDPAGENGGEGILTLINFPLEYEGKYVFLNAYHDVEPIDFAIIGMDYNASAGTQSLVRITNGNVNIPLWIQTFGESGSSIKRYSGNDTLQGFILINNYASLRPGNSIGSISYESITFSNGNAVKSFNDGVSYYELTDFTSF